MAYSALFGSHGAPTGVDRHAAPKFADADAYVLFDSEHSHCPLPPPHARKVLVFGPPHSAHCTVPIAGAPNWSTTAHTAPGAAHAEDDGGTHAVREEGSGPQTHVKESVLHTGASKEGHAPHSTIDPSSARHVAVAEHVAVV